MTPDEELKLLRARLTEMQARESAIVAENRALRATVEAQRCTMRLAGCDTRRTDMMAFFAIAEQEIPTTPRLPSESIIRRRLHFIVDEVFEMLEAFGLYPAEQIGGRTSKLARDIVLEAIATYSLDIDLPHATKELADVAYVVEGAFVDLGINADPVWLMVHESNLAKRGGPKDASGKVLKPAGWQPPDIAWELVRQGWAA